jgi:lipopolysaccharide export system permease protein
MRVLDRYIVKTLLAAVAVVTTVLLVLLALFMFISQQSEIGTGGYGSAQALAFVLLNLPDQLFQFLPIGAMIGALIGMGGLARSSELTVMRAAGVSIRRIAMSVAIAGLALAVLAFAVSEYLAPTLGQLAREQKALAKFANISFAGQGGAWVRDGDLILKVEQQSGDGAFGGLMVFDLASSDSLVAVGRAASASELPGGGWQLQGYAESRFSPGGVSVAQESARMLDTRISAAFLGVATADPTQMSVRALRSLIGYLRSNGQVTRNYEFALWSRVAKIVAVLFAVLLALPFVFGSVRSAGAGARATQGLVLGLAYFMAQKMVESGTLAFALDPLLLAWAPTLVLAVVVSALVLRLR